MRGTGQATCLWRRTHPPSSVLRRRALLARGGDRNAVISVAWTETLSTAPSNARGRVELEVLSHRKLHPQAVKLLKSAIAKNSSAMAKGPANNRQALIRGSREGLPGT